MCGTQAYGNATFFITFTANPTWPEITSALLPGQTWSDRPDIVCRVFKAKLDDMIARIKQGTAFKLPNGAPWPSMYIMYVVEFQKRGLPHAHIAVRLCYDQPRSAADIDRLICAKLPTVTSCTAPAEDCDCDNHRVVRTVLSKMVHRCSKSYCVDEHGVCAKHFPW